MNCLCPPVTGPHLRMQTVSYCPWSLSLLPLLAELQLPSLFVMYLTKWLSSGQTNSTNQLICGLFSDVVCCPHLGVGVYRSLLLSSICSPVCWSRSVAAALSQLTLCSPSVRISFVLLSSLLSLLAKVPEEGEGFFVHT